MTDGTYPDSRRPGRLRGHVGWRLARCPQPDHQHRWPRDARRLEAGRRRREHRSTATVRGTGLTTTFTANAAALQVSALNKVDGDNQAGFYGNLSPKQATVMVLQPVRRARRGRRGHVQHGVGRRHAAEDGRHHRHRWPRRGRRLAPRQHRLAVDFGHRRLPHRRRTPVTFSATATPVPASAFKIEVRYPDGEPSAEVKAAFDAAAAKWATIVVGDLEDVVLAGTDVMGPNAIDGNACIPLVANQTLDDLVIFAYVKHIDGAAGHPRVRHAVLHARQRHARRSRAA